MQDLGAIPSKDAWLVAIAIFGSAWIVARAIDRLTKLGERMLARFCDFAFDDLQTADNQDIARLSNFRGLVKAVSVGRNGDSGG